MAALTYNPLTYTITADSQTVRVDTIFQALTSRQSFTEDTIEHTLADFYTKMRYVPLYIYTDEGYRLLTHFVHNGTQSTLIMPEAFHQSLIAFLMATGYTVTVTTQSQQQSQQPSAN